MTRKIIIKSGRELTYEEISMIERGKIVFSTEDIGTSGHYDRFAGVRISPKITGAYDYISYLTCKVLPIGEPVTEYEVIFEETSPVRGLERERSGGRESGFNMPPLEQQLKHLQNTKLAKLLEEPAIIEQIKAKYDEEKKESDYYSTYHFRGEQESFWWETIRLLSDMELREKTQVEEIKDDGSKTLLNVIRNENGRGYELIEFPCKVKFELDGGKLKFSKCVSTKASIIERPRETIIREMSIANALCKIKGIYLRCPRTMPEDVSNEKELDRLIKEIQETQLENIDISELSFETIDKFISSETIDSSSQFKCFLDNVIEEHDMEYILTKIKDIGNNELKKRVMEYLSEKDMEYTDEQNESIKEILIELLKDENGWKYNEGVITRFSKKNSGTLKFSDKTKFLQMSIQSNNMFYQWLHKSKPNIIDVNKEIKNRVIELVNQLFTDEEHTALVEELIRQNNYQAIIIIIDILDKTIEEHDVEYILKRIEDTDNNELKKVIMERFSKKDVEYTEEQIERVKVHLTELLNDENGWKDNAKTIAEFSKKINNGTLNFSDKTKLLQMSIQSNNIYCQRNTYSPEREQREMKISELINQLFTDEEYTPLVDELISQNNYQTMIMILNECKFDPKKKDVRPNDKYSKISTEQKNKMVEEIMGHIGDIPEARAVYYESWRTVGVPYIVDYMEDKEQKQAKKAVEQLVDGKVFYEIGCKIGCRFIEQSIECFTDHQRAISTYINMKEAKKRIDEKGMFHIDIPKEYFGMMIGKQGKNIKRLEKHLKELMGGNDIKIILHPQKGRTVITIEDIEAFIEKQKTEEL